jgi:hypothetical protein
MNFYNDDVSDDGYYLSDGDVPDLKSYDTDAYGAQCRQTRNAVARIHQRAMLEICAQRERERETPQ